MKLTKLTYFYSYSIGCKYTLPSSVVSVYYGGANDNTGAGLDLAKCSNMTLLQMISSNGRIITENMILPFIIMNNGGEC